MIIYFDSGPASLFRGYFQTSGVDFTPLYRYYPRSRAGTELFRLPRKYCPKRMIYNLPEMAKEDDKLIVFDTHTTPQYFYWLCKNFPDKRILLWYWNPAPENRQFNLLPRRVEIWSYSPEDCARYGFRYNTQLYFDSLVPDREDKKARPAARTSGRRRLVLFIGRDKGRRRDILDIGAQLEQNGADTEFHFMKEKAGITGPGESLLPYTDVVEKARCCDALLDYTLNETAGLSLRPMEALFFGKKLITNQRSITQYSFYRRENIYILGAEKRTLREFLDEPYVMPDRKIRDYYRLSNWMKRFDQPEDIRR